MNTPYLRVDGDVLPARVKTLSGFYGNRSYENEILGKVHREPDTAKFRAAQPDAKAEGSSPNADEGQRSKKTGRLFPQPNKPDPMPAELAFLFTKISPEQMMYMWNMYTILFIVQCSMVVLYALVLLPTLPYWLATLLFGVPFAELMVQNVYLLHDVIHGATFPPYWWQKFLTHPFADVFSLPWEDVVLEHNRHHASTVDLLQHGEFGWDPAELVFALQEYSWCTALLVPFWHFMGASDTGGIFALYWFASFPDAAAGGKCSKDFWSKWFPRRVAHSVFVVGLWGAIWLLGTYPMGRSLSDGWRLVLPVYIAAKTGFSITWTIFTNFNHSHAWNDFLAGDPARTYPKLQSLMALILGGRRRFNKMLFHDLHHAFPNGVGALSQRGRFHGWEKVHDAAVEVLHHGLFVMSDTCPEPPMQHIQQKRSWNMMGSGSSLVLADGKFGG